VGFHQLIVIEAGVWAAILYEGHILRAVEELHGVHLAHVCVKLPERQHEGALVGLVYQYLVELAPEPDRSLDREDDESRVHRVSPASKGLRVHQLPHSLV